MPHGNCENKYPAMAAFMNAHAAAWTFRDFVSRRTSGFDDRSRRRHRRDLMGRRIATESYFKSGNDWIKTTRRRYVYQWWNVIAEYVNGARNKTYVWGEDLSGELQGAGGVGGLLLEQNACGDYLPVYDGNGNIIAYKNEEGSVISTYAYDPFGNVIAHAGMDFTYKFSTKPQDELSGMYYYGYRFYQPELGRWINREPIRERHNINQYGFCNNLPLLFLDYLGMSLDSPTASMFHAIATGNVAEVRLLLEVSGELLSKAAAAAGTAYLAKVAKCKALYSAYKKFKCKACKEGCTTPSQAKTSATCFSAEIAARYLYLKNNCDAILEGSIRRGTGVATRGHWDEYAQKQAAMYNCLKIALG